MSPPTRRPLLSAAIDPEDADFIEAMGGNRSAAIRRVVAAGVSTLKGETLAPEALAELREITARLESTLRRTATGCWYAATPEAMPAPDTLEAWDAVVMPHGLLVVAPQQAFTIDMVEGVLSLQGAGHGPISIDCDPRELLQLSCHFMGAIVEQAEVAGPCHLPMGVVLQRGTDDLIHLMVEGATIALPLDLALAVAAELQSLAVRSVDQTCQRREALEQALQGVAP